MSQNLLTPEQLKDVQAFQKNEITEYHIYQRIAKRVKKDNAAVLEDIAEEELRHCHFWKEYSGKEVRPNRWKVFKFYWITRIFGLTFGLKLMENGKAGFQEKYNQALNYVPEARSIIDDADAHEEELIGMIREKSLEYVGSIPVQQVGGQ